MQRLDTDKIGKIADSIYRRYFGDEMIDAISTDEFFDWTGEEAIKVTVMIKPGTSNGLKGGNLGEAALDLQDELSSAGEERFAHVRFNEIGGDFEDDESDSMELAFEDEDGRPRP